MRKFIKALWIVLIISIIVVAIGQGFLFFQMRKIRREIQDTNNNIVVLTGKLKDIEVKRNKIPELESFFNSLEEKLLLQSEAKTYIKYVTGALDKHTISYKLSVNNVETVVDKYEIVTIGISFKSQDLDSIIRILKTVESNTKWSEISQSPSIKKQGDIYTVSFSLTLPYITDIADEFWDIK